MPASNTWLLKIISGPHQGAEEALSEGSTVVGTGAECEIVLHDVLIAPAHFAFLRTGNEVTLEPLEGRVFCGGKIVRGSTSVPPFVFITVGTTHLVIGPAAERWPLLSAADAPELEKETPPPPPPAETATAGSIPAIATPTPAQRRRSWILAGLGGSLLLVWVFLWLRWNPAPSPTPAPDARARAEQVLQTFPDVKRVQIEQRGDRLLISGYLESDATSRELTTALLREAPEASLKLWSTPRMVETARTFLKERRLNLNVIPIGDGELRIAGAVTTAVEWERAKQMLLAEVPGLLRIQDDVTVAGAPGRVSPASLPVNEPGRDGLRLIAVQDAGDGLGWVRLGRGDVLFRGAQAVPGARLTRIEGDKANFSFQGREAALRAGDDLAEFLNAAPGATGPLEPAANPMVNATPDPAPNG